MECRDAGVTVSFATGSAELDTNARGALNGVATWLKANSARSLKASGFADPSGDPAQNVVLSERRAEAVKTYLVSQGVDANQVSAVGRGEAASALPAEGRTVTFTACQPAGGPGAQNAAPPPPPATAEVSPPPVAEPPPPPAYEPAPSYDNSTQNVSAAAAPDTYSSWGSAFGWGLTVGGGYEDFTDSNTRSRTTSGAGTWDVRLIGGTKSVIGFEAAYVGSARNIETLGVTANRPTLYSNGVQGAIRLNIPIVRGMHLIEPFAVGGLGWDHYSITNYNTNLNSVSDFNRDDDVLTIPVGAGLAYGYKSFLMDVRFNWVPTSGANLYSGGNLNTWGVAGKIGFTF